MAEGFDRGAFQKNYIKLGGGISKTMRAIAVVQEKTTFKSSDPTKPPKTSPCISWTINREDGTEYQEGEYRTWTVTHKGLIEGMWNVMMQLAEKRIQFLDMKVTRFGDKDETYYTVEIDGKTETYQPKKKK